MLICLANFNEICRFLALQTQDTPTQVFSPILADLVLDLFSGQEHTESSDGNYGSLKEAGSYGSVPF